MSRDSLLARGQAAAERGMVDACTITRTRVTSTNEDTGHQATTTTTVYSGRCRTQQHSPSGVRPTNAGEKHQLQLPNELQLPVSVTGVRTGDIVTITSSRDADLVGRTFKARELMHKTDATSRRIGIEEAT